MTTTDTFYQTSGASPPSESQAADAGAPLPDPPPLPAELIEDLARLLAEALIADIRQYPNLAEVQSNREATVESPSGLNHKARSARSRVGAQPGSSAPNPRREIA